MDITPLTSVSTSTPEEAAQNIQTANIFSIDPTNNKGINSKLEPDAQQSLKPTEAEPAVHDYMAQSTEHTAVASGVKDGVPDIHKLNWVDRQMKYWGDKLNGEYTAGQNVAELAFKKMQNGGKLNDEDTAELWQANQDQKTFAERNYDLSGPEKLPANIISGVVNFGRSAVRGAYDMATDKNLPPGHYLGKMAIGSLGFRQSVGAIYNEMPDTMDEGTKRHISLGAGVVSSAVMTLAPELADSVLPLLNPLTPKFVQMAMEAPEHAVLKMAAYNIGHSVATMASMNAAQEATNIVAEEMKNNYDGTSSSFLNALSTAGQKLVGGPVQTRQRLAEALGEGAATGAFLGGLGNLASKGAMRAQVDTLAEQGRDFVNNVTITKTGSPAGLIEGEAPPRAKGSPPSETPPERPPMKDVTPINPEVGDEVPVDHASQQAKEALEFHESLHQVNDVINSTQMTDVAPQEARGFMKKVFDRAGITKLYMTMTGARQFGIDPEKAAAIGNLSDIAKAQSNTPMAVAPEQVMDIARTHPEILDQVSSKPENPSGVQALDHFKNQETAANRRKEILSSLGIKDEEVQPEQPTNVKNIEGREPSEKAPYDLESDVRETNSLLGGIKLGESQIEKLKADMESNKKIDEERGATGISIKAEQEKAEIHLKNLQLGLDDMRGRLAEIKDRVTNHYKNEKQPGTLLFGHWSEPGIDDTLAAANGHLAQPTFTEAMKKALPHAEVEKVDAANKRARIDRLESIAEAAKYEMNKVHDIHVEELKDLRRQQELDRIANDPNYDIVDKFRNTKKEGSRKSLYQIDPRTLTDDQLKYADHYRMKEHGVFAKGGMLADEAAQMLGVKDGSELLKVLAQTPSRDQIVKARATANAEADNQAIRSTDDLNHTKIIEEIRDDARNHLEWMKFMREQEWPATKKAIKRIALPLPTIEGLQEKARQTIAKTKIGDLNPRQFAVGEARSNRHAIASLLKGDITSAYQAKEAAALNALLRKETMVQIGLANKTQKFFRKMQKPVNQQIFKDAGPLISNAFKELTTLWNLNPKAAPKELPGGLQGSFVQWAQKEIKDGRGDFTFPKALTELRQSLNDMTVEQLSVVDDRGRALYHEAKLEGYLQKMAKASDKAEHEYNLDHFEAESIKRLEAHPAFDKDRIMPPNKSVTGWQRMYYGFSEIEQFIAAKQYIYRELDEGKFDGWFHKNFNSEIDGTGENFEKSGFTKKRKLLRDLKPKVEALRKAHGDLDHVNGKFLDIPEFASIPGLNNGKNFTKGDLMRAYAFMAQEYSREKLFKNNGGDLETWTKVLDRELEPKDVEAMHSMGQLYHDLRPDIKAQQEADGREANFIEGIDVTHRGITRKGFYNPVQYVHEYTEGAARDAKDFLDDAKAAQTTGKSGELRSKQPASETTHQGYLISRTDNSEPLDLSLGRVFDGLADVIHDISYRTPLKNFFEKVGRPSLIKAMIAVVGEPKVENLIQTNLEIAGRPSSNSDGFFPRVNRTMKRYLTHFGNNFAIATLWGKSSVIIKQAEALPEFFNALGPKSVLTFARTNMEMIRNADKMDGYIAFAKRLDPSIDKYFSDIEDNATNVVHDLIPRKGTVPGSVRKAIPGKIRSGASSAGEALNKFKEFATQGGFLPVTIFDYYLKTSQALTIWNHIISGNHADFPMEKLQSMSDEEKFNAVQGVIHHMSTVTQIQNRNDLKAPLQKYTIMKPLTPFWNYPRNILNNTLIDARRTRWKSNEGWEKAKEGDFKGAAGSFKTATGIALGRGFWAMAGLTILGYAGNKGFQLTKKTINSSGDLAEAGMEMFSHLMLSPFEEAAEVVPGGSMMEHAIEQKRKYSRVEVTTPETQMLASFASCYQAVDNFLELSRSMSKTKVRACLEAESYLYTPLPVGAMYKAAKWLDQPPAPPNNTLSLNNIEHALEKMKEYVSNPPKDVDPKFVEGVKQLHDQIAPQVAEVPKGTNDLIKMAMSNGDWSKPNGLYGFSKEQWQDIKNQAPELALTDNGRIAKNTEQQEKAIDWSLNNDAKKLTEKEIPVNEMTLFGSHRLGVENYEKLYNAPNDEKAKAILPAKVLSENPDLANFKTVGQVKAYMIKTLDESARKKNSQNTANLTKPTNNAED